ncbi:MAG: hypothetical protein ACRESG_03250 [Gammaproteobacteria bacterium]
MLTPTLIWPGLDVAQTNSVRRIRARFERARKQSIPARDALALTAAALGIEASPAGALARLADGLPVAERSWFRAAPVSLLPDRDRLLVLPLDEAAQLSSQEAEALIAAAHAHFGSALALERGASGRWYAALADVNDVSSAPLDAVAGTQVDIPALAQGKDAALLRRFLNELQMLWYAHPVNVARREAGRSEANALWLWGGGRLPARQTVNGPVTIQASAPELVGLAIHCGLDHAPPGEPGTDTAGRIVVVAPGEEAIGQAWLAALAGRRAAFRLYTADVEWHIPARSGLSALFAW